MVPVDGQFCPLHPAIVWNDRRCEREAQDFAERFGRQYLYEKSGWHLGRGLSAMEILWLRRNKPEVFAKAAMFLSVPDYISAKLTGIPALDLSSAGINQLANIRAGKYNAEVLEFIDVQPEQLGKIVRSGEIIGPLTSQAAEELGLTEQTLLIAGAHDQYAVAAGAGCHKAGDILVGTGTAWVVTALSEGPDFESGFSQSVSAFGGLWGSLVSLSNGGVCLEWFRRKLTAAGREPLPYQAINAMAKRSGAGANGVLFYPNFGGGVRLTSAPATKGTFLGLELSHDSGDIARAIMEGVAFQTIWILEKFREKYTVSQLKLSGGAAKSPLWRQIIADIAGLPVQAPDMADLACVGAALLAGVGSGVYKSADEGYRRLAVREKEILPDAANVEKYRRLFAKYKEGAAHLGTLYQALQERR